MRRFTRARFWISAFESDAWRANLEPVRNVAVFCFESVTANSVCEAKPVRNVLTQTEPFAKSALGRLATASKPVRNALRFVVDASIAARFFVLRN